MVALTGAIAYGALRQLPLIATQVKALSDQIQQTREAEARAAENTRVWKTTEACRHLDSDPIFEAASKRIWDASDGGKKYDKGKLEERDLIIVLNYLETLAIGVRQGLYVEKIVKDHLEPAITKGVEKFVLTGLVEKDQNDNFEQLLALYYQWHPQKSPTYSAGSIGQ